MMSCDSIASWTVPCRASGGRRRRQRPLGHSFVIRYKLKSAEPRAVKDVEGEEREGVENFTEHTILFTKHNVGRKRSRYGPWKMP